MSDLKLVVKNTTSNIDLRIKDNADALVDPVTLTLKVYTVVETLLFQDDYVNGFGATPTPPTYIATAGTGLFSFPFGNTTIDAANTTAVEGEYLFLWEWTLADGAYHQKLQSISVASIRALRWLPRLRDRVDKARKMVDNDPDDPVFVGFTDQMLLQCLQWGLSFINALPITLGWGSVGDFPDAHWSLLLDAATLGALLNQEIFAIDTDVTYNDNGHGFTVAHYPQYAATINSYYTRLKADVPSFKRQYWGGGSISVELNVNSRLAQFINSGTSGAGWRNLYVSP